MPAFSLGIVRARAARSAAGPLAERALLEHLPFMILLAAAGFNAVLAFVNGTVTPLGPSIVIATEILLLAAAIVVALMHEREAMRLSVALLAWLFLFLVLRSDVVGPETSVKYFRDLLIAPAFMMLGLCTSDRHLNRYVLLLHAVVVAFAALEAFRVDAYAALFRVKDYFIATRGLTEADFWNTDSELFVSATRPDARFFPFLDGIMDAHRVSSIFLEPVSLGGYCVIASTFLFARWPTLGRGSRAFLLATTLFLMAACDGRLAFIAFAFILAACILWRTLPSRLPVLYLPGAVALAFAFVLATGQSGGSDDFPGRVAWTVDLLREFDAAEILGLSERLIDKAVDSGVAYIITTQSIVGLAFFWLYCALSSRMRTRAQICYAHGLCLYIAFNALVSYGFLSIKTASLLWMVKGVLESAGRQAPPR